MSSFLKNAWYVAALSPGVGRTLQAVRILGEAIVLYRTQDNTPVALEDACPHRKLPLSMVVPALVLAAATVYFGLDTSFTVTSAAQAAAWLMEGPR